MNKESTRDLLLDAAKRQFIRNGFDGVSMMDIARESGMSRRTLYSYFESKGDIYNAAVKRETDLVVTKLHGLVIPGTPASKKITDYVYGRFHIIKEMVDRNGTLRSFFFRNNWNLEHFRKELDRQEKQILIDIVVEGVTQGMFDVPNVNLIVEMIQDGMRGFEYTFIRGIIWKTASHEDVRQIAANILFSMLGYKENK
ncbi:MAG: TetR/AcrR family transcriptional regulator [Bacteroidaceae bacterium]|nr:TetR/AcrR family transcriptional regulator [Bacteroidaceae bacterium]